MGLWVDGRRWVDGRVEAERGRGGEGRRNGGMERRGSTRVRVGAETTRVSSMCDSRRQTRGDTETRSFMHVHKHTHTDVITGGGLIWNRAVVVFQTGVQT